MGFSTDLKLTNGLTLEFNSLQDFDPQVNDGQNTDLASLKLAGIVGDAPLLGFATSLLLDDRTTPLNEGLLKIQAFIETYAKQNPGTLAKLGITDIHALTPRQAVLLTNQITIEKLQYSHLQTNISRLGGQVEGKSGDNVQQMNDAIPVEILLTTESSDEGNGVCRNYAETAFALFETLKAMQDANRSKLNTTFCVISGFENWNSKNVPGFVDFHAWNSFVTIEGDKVHAIVTDPTWADRDHADLTNDNDLHKLDYTFNRLNSIVRRFQAFSLLKPEDLITEYTKDYKNAPDGVSTTAFAGEILFELSQKVFLGKEDEKLAIDITTDFFSKWPVNEKDNWQMAFIAAGILKRINDPKAAELISKCNIKERPQAPESFKPEGIYKEMVNVQNALGRQYHMVVSVDCIRGATDTKRVCAKNEDALAFVKQLGPILQEIDPASLKGLNLRIWPHEEKISGSLDTVAILVSDDADTIKGKISQRYALRQRWQDITSKYRCVFDITGYVNQNNDNETWSKLMNGIDEFFGSMPEYKYRYRVIVIHDGNGSTVRTSTGNPYPIAIRDQDILDKAFAKIDRDMTKAQNNKYDQISSRIERFMLFHGIEQAHPLVRGVDSVLWNGLDNSNIRMMIKDLNVALSDDRIKALGIGDNTIELYIIDPQYAPNAPAITGNGRIAIPDNLDKEAIVAWLVKANGSRLEMQSNIKDANDLLKPYNVTVSVAAHTDWTPEIAAKLAVMASSIVKDPPPEGTHSLQLEKGHVNWVSTIEGSKVSNTLYSENVAEDYKNKLLAKLRQSFHN